MHEIIVIMADQDKNKEIDYKKFFDPKQYNTVIVKKDGQTEFNDDKITNLVNLLTDPANKEYRRDVLSALRENQQNAVPILIEAIRINKSRENSHMLVAACWEAELNFSNHLPFFTQLAIEEPYLLALEAITVIENMSGPFNKQEVSESIKKLEGYLVNGDQQKGPLLNELLITLQSLSF